MRLDWIPVPLYSGLSSGLIYIPEFLTTALMTIRPLPTQPVSRLPNSFKRLFEAHQSHFSHCPLNFPFK